METPFLKFEWVKVYGLWTENGDNCNQYVKHRCVTTTDEAIPKPTSSHKCQSIVKARRRITNGGIK